MGRSLANNITNLLLDPVWSQLCKKHQIDPLEILEQEPDAGLGNGGLGRLAACFLDSMATLGIPGIGSGLRYEYGIFKQTVRDGWQHEQPDHWLARPDLWEVPRPDEAVQVHLACSFEIHAGALWTVQGRPSTLIGIPYDRPVVGYSAKTSTRRRGFGSFSLAISTTPRTFLRTLCKGRARASWSATPYVRSHRSRSSSLTLRGWVLPSRANAVTALASKA